MGTCFTFTLPAAEHPGAVPTADAAAGGAPPADEDRGPVPVLVVDDDPETLRHVRDALAAGGYAPLAAGSPAEVAIRGIRRRERQADPRAVCH